MERVPTARRRPRVELAQPRGERRAVEPRRRERAERGGLVVVELRDGAVYAAGGPTPSARPVAASESA